MDCRILGHDGASVFAAQTFARSVRCSVGIQTWFEGGSLGILLWMHRGSLAAPPLPPLIGCYGSATRAAALRSSLAMTKHGARDFARFFVMSLHGLDVFALRFSTAFFGQKSAVNFQKEALYILVMFD